MKTAWFRFAVLLLSSVCLGLADSYDNSVWKSGNQYFWKTAGGARQSTTNLTEAINGCIWQAKGDREVHILAGGDLTFMMRVPSNIKVHGHGNTFKATHGGNIFNPRKVRNIGFYDMKLTGAFNMAFRISTCDDVVLSGIHIVGGFMGMRIESNDSRSPWLARNYNLTILDCTVENMWSHGIETYSIENIYVDNIVARNTRGCGVLFNNSSNGYVGSVDAYRCAKGGGYAGLRFANGNRDFHVRYVRSIECGRGFFVCTGGSNIVVEELYVRDCTSHAILIQHSDQVGVNSGTHDGFVINHYTSQNCWVLATDGTKTSEVPPPAAQRPKAVTTPEGVSLSWTAVPGARQYLVQRKRDDAKAFLTTALVDVPAFVDQNVAPSGACEYRIRATNAAGQGNPSEPVRIFVGQPPTAVQLSRGLVVHASFDGTAVGARDTEMPKMAGRLAYEEGQIGQALVFDGTTTHGTLPPQVKGAFRNCTVATWVRWDSDANGQRIIDFGSDTSNYVILMRHGSHVHFQIRREGVTEGIHTELAPLGQWGHVAATIDGNRVSLYLNGVLQKRMLFANNPASIAFGNNFIGKSRWDRDPLLAARLDDLRLYDRALRADEVRELALAARGFSAAGFGRQVLVR